MSSNIINKGALLREQRLFPQESQPLSVEVDRSYVDIASKLNDRTIGFFPVDGSALSGEKWSIDGIIYSGYRRVYSFTAAGNIAHGLTVTSVKAFTKIYGTFTDGSIWYSLPYVNVVAANNQVSVTVTGTNIVITAGGGAPPAITQGYVVLEWVSQS